jgi:DNA excision repair protein ERCC-4
MLLADEQAPEGKRKENPSPWLLLDAADTLFDTAKRRVYTGKLTDARAGPIDRSSSPIPDTLHPVLEELPKWEMLAEVLEEIERDVYFNPVPQDDSSGAVLIMCGDIATCNQLKDYLQSMHARTDRRANAEDGEDPRASGEIFMRRKLRNYIHWRRQFTRITTAIDAEKTANAPADLRGTQASRGRAPPNKRRRVRGGSSAASAPGRDFGGRTAGDREAHLASLLTELEITETEAQQKEEIVVDSLDRMEDYYELYDLKDLIVLHPFDGDMDEHVLDEVRPRYVIMYEPDAAFIRRIEVYRSSHTDRNVRVYFMYYGGSVEEQRYLSAVRKEKDAFTKLIRERGSMAITLDTHGGTEEEQFLRTINTRIAGGGRLAATAVQPRIICDMREFRSSLTGLLHARSVDVVPAQLTVGDYILTPNICVERKSVSDLIGSFKNGRLFHQVETMLEHYKNPMLLIEFGDTKSFTLEQFADLSHSAAAAAMGTPDLQSKIVMLTLHFPKLRIIWSSSPYQTAEIFDELKKQQEEPDPYTAVKIGLEPGEDPETGRTYNQDPMDMIRNVPGVNEKNLVLITLNVGSVRELANMDEDEICGLVGREAGRQVWRFFNRDVVDE